jgi:hypothetical protein
MLGQLSRLRSGLARVCGLGKTAGDKRVEVEKVTSEMGRSRGEVIGSPGVCLKPLESLDGPVLRCVGISAKDGADLSGSALEDLPSHANGRPIGLSI